MFINFEKVFMNSKNICIFEKMFMLLKKFTYLKKVCAFRKVHIFETVFTD